MGRRDSTTHMLSDQQVNIVSCVFGFVVAVAILAIIVIGAISCRNYQINSCREGGGRPVTHSLLSGRAYEVGCVEAGQ